MGEVAVLDVYGLVAGEADFAPASQRRQIQKRILGRGAGRTGNGSLTRPWSPRTGRGRSTTNQAVLDEDQVAGGRGEGFGMVRPWTVGS